MRRLLLTSIFTVALATLAHGQAPLPFTTQDVLDVVRISVADITDDGAFVVARLVTDRDRKNVDHMRFGDPTYISPSTGQLVVIDASDGSIEPIFDDRVQVRNARWSPDGNTVAFFFLEGDRYVLYTYDRTRDRAQKIEIQTDKQIASNSPLAWRPDGSGVLLTLRETGWAEAAHEHYRRVSFGPTIVQDSKNDFLAWDAVRMRSSIGIPAIVNLRSREVREVLPEGSYNGFTQSDDGGHLTFTESTRLRTAYERNKGTDYEIKTLALASGEIISLSERDEDRINASWNDAGTAFAYADDGDVFVRSIDGSDSLNLTEDYRTPVSEDDSTKLRYSVLRWRPDDAALLVRSQHGFEILRLVPKPRPETG